MVIESLETPGVRGTLKTPAACVRWTSLCDIHKHAAVTAWHEIITTLRIVLNHYMFKQVHEQ